MKLINYKKLSLLSCISVAIILLITPLVSAHKPAAERAEVWSAGARLFVADNGRSEVVAIDLPDGQVVSRITVPPKVMIMARTEDGAYIVILRGRDTDRQHLTVIASGVEPDGMHRPYVAKTLLLGRGMGGVHADRLDEVWGKLVLVADLDAKIFRFEQKALAPEAAFTPEVIPLGRPDHHDLLEMAELVGVGCLGQGVVRLLDQQGKDVTSYPCKNFHGAANHEQTGRSFFACADGLLVIEEQKEIARIAYPVSERIGNLMKGDGKLIGSSEGVENLQILNPEKLTLTAVPLGSKLMTRTTSKDGNFVFLLLQNSTFEVRNGATGELIRSIVISTPFPQMEEDVTGAVLPSIAMWQNRAYVSLPQWGMIAEVDWKEGKLQRNLMVGGSPSRMVVIEGEESQKINDRRKDKYR